MLRTRVITTVIGLPVLLGVLFKGGIFWDTFFVLLGMIGLWEFYSMMRQKGFIPIVLTGYLLLYLLAFYDRLGGLGMVFLFLIFAIVVVGSVIKYPKINITDIALSLTGAFYLGGLLYYPIKIATLREPFLVILLVFLLTWTSDTGGYIGGRLLGKHKLAPRLSPGKTWEGAVGAIIFPIIAAGCFSVMAMKNVSPAYVLILGLLVGVTAQFGDLFMSSIKRYFEVKDSGWIIPGHGGVLDRFDSFLMVAPVVYYYFQFFIR
ncbi:MAG: phosphatidate cytidylyltransferase [Syntrophomonas sp.]